MANKRRLPPAPPPTVVTIVDGKQVLPPVDRPAKMALIVSMLMGGHYLATALRAAGVTSTVYRYWMGKGQEALLKSEDARTPEDNAYIEFAFNAHAAESVAEEAAVAVIRAHMPRDWRAAAFFLERRYPGRWRARTEDDDVSDDELNASIRSELGRLAQGQALTVSPETQADADSGDASG